jgi:nucleoid DNA-binding protein
MSKRILVEQMRLDNPGLTTIGAGKSIDMTFAGARSALEGGAPFIVIPGFGTFRRKLRETRTVRNPRTGETSTKVAHHVITFKEAKAK